MTAASRTRALALMPLFLSVRAAIRAKVTGFTALSPEHVGDRERLSAQARAYLALAGTALEPSPVMLVAISGRSGTGESSVAAVVAPRVGAMPGAMVLRSDVVRKQLVGREPASACLPRHMPLRWLRRVYGCMLTRAGVLLRAGRTVICDGVYGFGATSGHRARRNGPWRLLPRVLAGGARGCARSAGTARTGDASDADLAVVRRQRELVDPRW